MVCEPIAYFRETRVFRTENRPKTNNFVNSVYGLAITNLKMVILSLVVNACEI